jgi:hypothetical protein
MQEISQDTVVELSEPQTAVLSARTAIILDMAGQGSGKSRNIGYSSGMFISDFPQVRGFIGANTNMQLSQSTLSAVFQTWKTVYGFTEYNDKMNRAGNYVVDKKPPAHFQVFHQLREYSGTISFWNGCLIFIGSLENYIAHEGKEFGWAHLDETKDTRERALKDVILGRLRQYGIWARLDSEDLMYDENMNASQAEAQGWFAWNPLYIHTSPALGGVDWLNNMFKLRTFAKQIKAAVTQEERAFFYKVFENKTVVIYPVHHNRHNLPPNYIENQTANQGDEDAVLRIVCGYPFAKMGGEYFPSFRRDKIVAPQRYLPDVAIHSTWDFNVIPFMTNILVQIDFEPRYLNAVGTKFMEPQPGFTYLEVLAIRVYKEYCFDGERNTTEAICEQFKSDHAPGPGFFYYGDAAGASRIPGLGSLTNYKILEAALVEYIHNGSKKVRVPNVGIFKRRDLLNKIFAGKIPEVEIWIDNECVKLIDDLENVKLGYKGKVKEKEKGTGAEKYGHPTDALEYLVSEVCKRWID